MAASISSTFDIVWTGSLNGAAATIANPGRAFSIVGMTAAGGNNGTLTLTRSGTGGSVAVVTASTAVPSPEGVITPANIEFAATDNLIITAATAAFTRAVITCQAASAPSLAVS